MSGKPEVAKRLNKEDTAKAIAFVPPLIAELFPLPMNCYRFTDPKVAQGLCIGVIPEKRGIIVHASKTQTWVIPWCDVVKILEVEKGQMMSESRAMDLCEQMRAGERDEEVEVQPMKKEDGKEYTEKGFEIVGEITERDFD